MKKISFFLILAVCCSLKAIGQTANRAILLDGKDNKPATGLGIFGPAWTLEARVCHTLPAKAGPEYIIGGGEYSDFDEVENRALFLQDGMLRSERAKFRVPYPDDGRWHHVALTCDGRATRLFLDGVCVASRDTAMAVLPGSVGVYDTHHTFGGLIDEVRVWSTAISPKTLNRWRNKTLLSTHPCFASLKAYYPMDDADDEMSLNPVSRSARVTHLRLGRSDFRGKAPLAHAVPYTDATFRPYTGRQRLFSATVVPNEWDADPGTRGTQVLKLRLYTSGAKRPLRLTALQIDLSGCTDAENDIEALHIYYTGGKARSAVRRKLFSTDKIKRQTLIDARLDTALTLSEGANYVLLAFDVSPRAVTGHCLDAALPSVTLGGRRLAPVRAEGGGKRVSGNHTTNEKLLKVMQWNIWHGGVHLGGNGQERVIDELRKAGADVVHLQEGYGIQQKAATALRYHLNTRSASDNLAQLTRYPVTPISTRHAFNSCPSVLTLPSGQRVLLADCWLRYAYRPAYTTYYLNPGGNPNRWVAEDSTLSLVDISRIVEEDLAPYAQAGLPTIVSGDFNSFSHLDWTLRARPEHRGLGPIPFPATRYMQQNGFTDTFRAINPDETTAPGCTWAPIYGQYKHARIDFIFSRGAITPLLSKTVRSSSETDFVWPGDHAAVITLFRLDSTMEK